ncbi:MAG: GNAT family N-acetyltransferase [Anaerolineales bacterium]|nr:GNAT family N-acetyltransferase [Anaerolineales bacterium]
MIGNIGSESVQQRSYPAGSSVVNQVIQVQSEAQFEAFCKAGGRPLSPEQCRRERADAHLLVIEGQALPAARCSVWWRCVPVHPTEQLGIIGHYAADNDAAAAIVLAHARALLAEHGCTYAVGPMDGSTFRAYRLVTARAADGPARPPFLLEPDTPPAWVGHFEHAGFEPVAHYVSSLAPLRQDERLPGLREQVAQAGIAVRPIDLTNFETDLHRIYAVVTASFQQNFLYSPLEEGEFVAQYAAARSFTRRELVWVAERAGATVGFVFAYPDLAQQQRGEPIDTVIIKTLAVTPGAGGLGLGGLLTAEVQQAALELGYTQAIHALMISDNRSRRISAHYSRVIREYALYGRNVA